MNFDFFALNRITKKKYSVWEAATFKFLKQRDDNKFQRQALQIFVLFHCWILSDRLSRVFKSLSAIVSIFFNQKKCKKRKCRTTYFPCFVIRHEYPPYDSIECPSGTRICKKNREELGG